MSKEKEIGVELLRIVAMFMICMGHVNISIWANISDESKLFPWVSFMELACIYGVNIFGLITGYLGGSMTIRMKKFFRLWAEVFFYTLISLFIALLFFPEMLNKALVVQLIFPISRGIYWYITAYFCVLLVSPILNNYISNLSGSRNYLFIVCVLAVIIYSFFINDVFQFGWGYNAVWLIFLYCLGAAIKNLEYGKVKSVHPRAALIFVIAWLISLIINWVLKITVARGTTYINDRILRYDNILVLIGSLALFILFIKIDIKTEWKKRIVCYFSTSCLAVYLIQVNPIYWINVISQEYVYLLEGGSFRYVSHLLFHSIITFLAFITIDKIRIFLFKMLRIDNLIDFASHKCDVFITGILSRYESHVHSSVH